MFILYFKIFKTYFSLEDEFRKCFTKAISDPKEIAKLREAVMVQEDQTNNILKQYNQWQFKSDITPIPLQNFISAPKPNGEEFGEALKILNESFVLFVKKIIEFNELEIKEDIFVSDF